MVEILPIATLLLLLLLILLSVLIFLRAQRGGSSQRLESEMADLNEGIEKLERVLREEFGRNREEAGIGGRQLREEITASVRTSGDTIAARTAEIATLQNTQLETFGNQLTMPVKVLSSGHSVAAYETPNIVKMRAKIIVRITILFVILFA